MNARTSDLESRFDFDGPGIYEATAAEITAQLLSIDKAHIRRRSEDKAAPAFTIDGNDIAKILMLAIAVEKKTYQHRKKGSKKLGQKCDQRGVLGSLSIELLKVLIWYGRKYGQIFPGLKKLASALRKCTDTITDALNRLIDQGFVTKHRRSKMITTPQGKRRKQDSNAYEVHLPAKNVGAARIPSLQALVSDTKSQDVSCQTQGATVGNLTLAFDWVASPYRMRDGSWH